MAWARTNAVTDVVNGGDELVKYLGFDHMQKDGVVKALPEKPGYVERPPEKVAAAVETEKAVKTIATGDNFTKPPFWGFFYILLRF